MIYVLRFRTPIFVHTSVTNAYGWDTNTVTLCHTRCSLLSVNATSRRKAVKKKKTAHAHIHPNTAVVTICVESRTQHSLIETHTNIASTQSVALLVHSMLFCVMENIFLDHTIQTKIHAHVVIHVTNSKAHRTRPTRQRAQRFILSVEF